MSKLGQVRFNKGCKGIEGLETSAGDIYVYRKKQIYSLIFSGEKSRGRGVQWSEIKIRKTLNISI